LLSENRAALAINRQIARHQGKENQLLVNPKTTKRRKVKPPGTISLVYIRCEQKLGGLLNSYKWAV
jgi:hypothetical protein